MTTSAAISQLAVELTQELLNTHDTELARLLDKENEASVSFALLFTKRGTKINAEVAIGYAPKKTKEKTEGQIDTEQTEMELQ